MLTVTDYGVMVFYGVLVLGIGIFAKSLVHNLDDYFAARRRVPWWMAAISHHMSGYSAFVFVGYASVAYNLGFNIWTLSALPIAIALVVGAFVWAPRWVRLQVLTPVEYLERWFNNLVRQLCAWSGILIKFVDEGTKLYSLALIVHVSTGIRQDLLIIGCGVVAIFYVMIGGLWADILTDLGQFFVQFSITLLLVPLVLKTVGGWNEMWRHLPADHLSLFSKE